MKLTSIVGDQREANGGRRAGASGHGGRGEGGSTAIMTWLSCEDMYTDTAIAKNHFVYM